MFTSAGTILLRQMGHTACVHLLFHTLRSAFFILDNMVKVSDMCILMGVL
jgi:hypothetical protein